MFPATLIAPNVRIDPVPASIIPTKRETVTAIAVVGSDLIVIPIDLVALTQVATILTETGIDTGIESGLVIEIGIGSVKETEIGTEIGMMLTAAERETIVSDGTGVALATMTLS